MGVSIGVPVVLTLIVQRFVKLPHETKLPAYENPQESELND